MWCAEIGLNPDLFRLHSLRRGHVNDGLDHGIHKRLLQHNGQWTSKVAFEGYIEDEMGLCLLVQEYSNVRHSTRAEPATQDQDEQ